MGKEHRKDARHHVRFHLVYDDGSSFNAGAVHDVSEGGLFLETALPLPVGTEVRLTPLDDLNENDTLFEVRARVMRSVPYEPNTLSDQPAGMGLQFLDLSEQEQVSVVAMIRKLEAKYDAFQGAKDPYLGVMVESAESEAEPDEPEEAEKAEKADEKED